MKYFLGQLTEIVFSKSQINWLVTRVGVNDSDLEPRPSIYIFSPCSQTQGVLEFLFNRPFQKHFVIAPLENFNCVFDRIFWCNYGVKFILI